MKKKTQTTKESQPRSPNNKFESNAPGSGTRAGGDAKAAVVSGNDIIELILTDHIPLKSLIETLKDDETKRAAKEGPFEEFAFLLLGHAKSEEQSLYVAMKEYTDLKMPGYEGDTEHAIADQLVQEINATPDDNEWLAKVKVLAEMVEHHIQEEEEDMLKEVEEQIPEDVRMNIGSEYTALMNEYAAINEIQPPHQYRFNRTGPLPTVSTLA